MNYSLTNLCLLCRKPYSWCLHSVTIFFSRCSDWYYYGTHGELPERIFCWWYFSPTGQRKCGRQYFRPSRPSTTLQGTNFYYAILGLFLTIWSFIRVKFHYIFICWEQNSYQMIGYVVYWNYSILRFSKKQKIIHLWKMCTLILTWKQLFDMISSK